MSNFNNIKIGDRIYVTGIEADLYECNDDYEALLSVVNQFCEVLDINDNIQLWAWIPMALNTVGGYCRMVSQKGVLIQSPKLQGHDGGGRCPEFNCYWIGKDYLSFESMSLDDTMDIFDKLNESDESEIFKEISHEDLEVGMRVVVNGDADPWGTDGGNIKFNNELGKVVYNWNENEEDNSNSFTIAFDNWDKGHDGGTLTDVCGVNKCWSFYDDCAYSDYRACENISKLQFYTINSYDLFDQLNESKDEFDWVEDIVKNIPAVVDYRTVKQGDKVVPGKDWEFGNQAQGSVYGIVDLGQYEGVFKSPIFIDDSTDEEFHQYWVNVDWVDKNDNPNFRNNYRVGPNYYDLKYYVPKPINIEESVDDFDWVEDIVNSDLKFGSVKGDLKIGDVITITGDIIDTDGTLLVDLDEEPFLVVKNNKFELYGHIYKPGEYSYRIELNWFNPNSKRPSNWQRASMHSDDGKDIISFTDDTEEWDDGLIVKFLKK